MLGLDNYIAEEKDWPVYFLWRFMIGTEYQGKGYGKQTLDLIVQKCKEEGRKYLYVSSTSIDPMPYQMYINYGFEDIGLVDDIENELKLKIIQDYIRTSNIVICPFLRTPIMYPTEILIKCTYTKEQ